MKIVYCDLIFTQLPSPIKKMFCMTSVCKVTSYTGSVLSIANHFVNVKNMFAQKEAFSPEKNNIVKY